MARMPRTQSVSAWASYLKDTGLTVSEARYRTSSNDMKEWLDDNEEKIADAVAEVEETEVAVATFVTPAEIIEEPEEDDTKAVRGERV